MPRRSTRGPTSPATAYRTHRAGRGRRRRPSPASGPTTATTSSPLDGDGCLVAHPLVDEVLRAGRFAGADRGHRPGRGVRRASGSSLADPTGAPMTGVPDDVVVVGADELAGGRRAWFHEEVAGRRWRISAESFFQARPDGAAALVDARRRRASARRPRRPTAPATVVDLYGGVGLFAGAAGRPASAPMPVQLVEANRSVGRRRQGQPRRPRRACGWCGPTSASGARRRPTRSSPTRPATASARRWSTASPPPGPRTVVLVSCDPGALGRDAGLLAAAGYRLDAVDPGRPVPPHPARRGRHDVDCA